MTVALCDLVLVFMVTVSPGVEERRTINASHKDAEKIVDDSRNGRFVGFSAVTQFDCAKGPKKEEE